MVVNASSRTREPIAARTSPAILGLWTFIGSEAIFFGCLIAAYLYLRVRGGVWPPPDMPHLDLLVPAINTVVLLSSGVTMHGAHESIRRGDDGMLRWGTVATMILGAAFLAGQAYEYSKAGFGLSSGILGSSFFTLTGFHGAHVFVGLVFLALVLARASGGHYSPERHEGVAAAALYWHFVDAVWVALFTVLYLI